MYQNDNKLSQAQSYKTNTTIVRYLYDVEFSNLVKFTTAIDNGLQE